MKSRKLFRAVFAAAVVWLLMAAPASACPMCKFANETESRLPHAYMCSILFMLSMPATLATMFGIGFYRLSRKASQMQAEAAEEAPSVDASLERTVP